MKLLRFVGSAQDDLKNFPDEARRHAGFELHAFQKKAQKTRKEDIDLAARRFRQIAGE